ncbi:MAG: cell wall-binding repeat-containing protein, partial [Eubacteriales bacterium]
DALAGAVLANSAIINGPLLLTESNRLRPEVLEEIKRLHTQTVYILGGQSAITNNVENELKANGLQICRLQGNNRFETAASIATTAVKNSDQAYLASGSSFADALSISSYAASKGIPLLLTEKDKVPDATLNALKLLGVKKVTLIGGEGVISPNVKEQLESSFQVDRLGGANRYLTNIAILNSLDYDTSQILVATGTAFPDALAGSVLAAKNSNPILLVPKADIPSQTITYLNTYRPEVNKFSILGGWGVINYEIESIVRTGTFHPRISLHFWDGRGNYSTYVKQLSYVPDNLTDYIDILSPNFTGILNDDGSFGSRFETLDYPQKIVALGQSYGAKVVPLIGGSGETADSILQSSTKRLTLVNNVDTLIKNTNADGILVDLEILSSSSEEGLTSLMKELYERLHPQNKLVIVSVFSRTSPTAEPWLKAFNYHDLAQYVDYLQVMSYDKHYTTSAPGPIAPLEWVDQVMAYAVSQVTDTNKILMGMPYYGRAWKTTDNGYTSYAFGLAGAIDTANEKNAVITRYTTEDDPIGIPTFKFTDDDGCQRTAFFDDNLSWGAKLDLLNKYSLGGIGSWSMGWINEESSSEIYPLIKERLRL